MVCFCMFYKEKQSSENMLLGGGGSLLFVVLIKMVSNNTAFQVLAVIFENTVFILCNSLMRNFVKFSVFNIFGAS